MPSSSSSSSKVVYVYGSTTPIKIPTGEREGRQKGDVITITKRAIWLVCQRCKHGWHYTGSNFKAICGKCGTSVMTGIR